MKALSGLLLLAFAPIALAESPFCLVSNFGYSSCYFLSLDACRQSAKTLGGTCVPNPAAMQQQQVQIQPVQPAYQAPQPFVQQQYPNYADSFARGWQQGEQMKRDQQRATLERMAAIYFSGGVAYEKRTKFLADIAKNGGDAAWYRDDMEQRDAAARAASPPPQVPPSPQPGETFSYFPESPPQASPTQPSPDSTVKDLEIALLRSQLETAKIELARTKANSGPAPEPAQRLARFTGRQEQVSAGKLKCEYDIGGETVLQESYGSCPASISYP
jgi:hypothetical protein